MKINGAEAMDARSDRSCCAREAPSAAIYLLDFGRQIEIVPGQAAGAMRAQIYGDLVPRVGPVRMMVHFLGGQREPGHKTERLREILEFEYTMEVAARYRPTGKLPKLCGDFLF